MTFKQIEAFYWAATLASFSLAAERLHLSQSSLSKRLAELEAQLGKPLFDRSGHRASLTTAGQTFLPLARKLLRTVDEVRESMADTPVVKGVCRFGMGELAALSWLPRFVARARELYPELVLEPRIDMGRVLEEKVESGELDFAVVAGTSRRGAITSHAIRDVNFLWGAAPVLVGSRRLITSELLAQVAVITMPSDAGSAREFDNWLIRNELEVDRRLECNNLAAIAGMVVAGVGMSFLPEAWVRQLSARGDVVVMESRPPLPPLSYSFQARRDDIRPLVRQMRQLVGEVADFGLPSLMI